MPKYQTELEQKKSKFIYFSTNLTVYGFVVKDISDESQVNIFNTDKIYCIYIVCECISYIEAIGLILIINYSCHM